MPERTLRQAIADTAALLKQGGIENPRLDARVLTAHVIEADTAHTFLRSDMELTQEQEQKIGLLVGRRLVHEPVARIVGQREFWGMPFDVTTDTLDPRADSEVLVSAIIDHRHRIGSAHPKILDLGTGTGCILLALLHEIPEATGVGIDLSHGALTVAQRNAARNGLSDRANFLCMSWMEALQGPFNIIVANPPYLSAADMSQRSPEVRFDPERALFGGDDGLSCYRAIIGDLSRVLARPGLVAFETGLGQARQVSGMLESAGFRVVEVRPDLAAIPRCVVAQI